MYIYIYHIHLHSNVRSHSRPLEGCRSPSEVARPEIGRGGLPLSSWFIPWKMVYNGKSYTGCPIWGSINGVSNGWFVMVYNGKSYGYNIIVVGIPKMDAL